LDGQHIIILDNYFAIFCPLFNTKPIPGSKTMSKVKAAVCGMAGTNLTDLQHLDQFVHTHK
jgi:hypothetical protein